jgi:hypothetical protein
MELGSGLPLTNISFSETQNGKFMAVRSKFQNSEWNKTIDVCMRCKFNEDQIFTPDYIEILCSNKNNYEAMKKADWCSGWGTKT